MKRKAGILLNVSSFPGKYGIGGFSSDAEKVLDEFAMMGIKLWQTLPVTALGAGNSPYSGVSSFAGNYLYIDPERLDGLLTADEAASFRYNGDVYLTDYAFASAKKREALELAYSRIGLKEKEGMELFIKDNTYWLPDYAAYMTLKEKNGGAMWSDWADEEKFYSEKLCKKVKKEMSERYNFYVFEQYVFFSQWKKIHDYAASYGIEVFGDLPIYVNYDSSDVWAHTDLFLLDKELRRKKVAGVPPDYFAKDGQLWGNPLYDYEKMALTGYKWWVERLCHALKLYDVVRIDHFRGLYEYWAVDAEENTAKNGKWEKGPDLAIFKELKKKIKNPKIVAEDLGIIDDNIRDFLKRSGFYGMRVFQFGFDGDANNKHLPHEYIPECVAYTGTHDNDTTLGWLLSLDENTRRQVFDYVDCDDGYGWASGAGRCRATKAVIRSVLSSCADIAIIPMQDLCGYGSDTRMNVPGKAEDCWRYRTNFGAINGIDHDFLRKIIRIYGR